LTTASVAKPPRAGRRLLLAVAGLVAVLVALWLATGFLKSEVATARFLADVYDLVGLDQQAALMEQYGLNPTIDKLVIALVALVVGIAGIWALFITTNAVVDELGPGWMERVRPWVFVLPAAALLGFYLVFPIVRTLITSVTDRPEGTALLDNYGWAFTQPDNVIAMRNNVVWLVLGTGGSVLIGLAFATLVDRVRREALAKSFVFLPLAISMVGAAVVWRFMYYWRPPGQPQIGFLNAIITGLGGEPFPFFQTPPVNTLALIVIMVWLQVGFAMVVLSAAIKGVSTDLLEAARIDGAGELQIFRRIVVPSIRGSIITVATTIAIAILKVFDIVFVTTGGNFDTDVVANRMFDEMIRFRNNGKASALAAILFVAVVPIMVINIRNLRRQGAGP
jgi:alpha-glucoside transport system permease protein